MPAHGLSDTPPRSTTSCQTCIATLPPYPTSTTTVSTMLAYPAEHRSYDAPHRRKAISTEVVAWGSSKTPICMSSTQSTPGSLSRRILYTRPRGRRESMLGSSRGCQTSGPGAVVQPPMACCTHGTAPEHPRPRRAGRAPASLEEGRSRSSMLDPPPGERTSHRA